MTQSIHRLGVDEERHRHTRVIKLSRLANCKTTTSNYEHLLDVDELAGFYDTAGKVGLRVGGGLGSTSAGPGSRQGE